MPWLGLYSLTQNRRKGHVAVTTPTSTEGMMGSKNRQGKPPRPVTWGAKWRSTYKRKKRKKHFKEETSASKRVTLEKRKWVISSADLLGAEAAVSGTICASRLPLVFPSFGACGAWSTALSSNTDWLQKARERGCCFRVQPQLDEAKPDAVFQVGESSFHPVYPMVEQEGCYRTQEGGRMPAEAASWHCSSDLSSSQEPQGVVRQKVVNKHLQGPAASGLRALNSELQIMQGVDLQPQESEEQPIASNCGYRNLPGPKTGISYPHNFDARPFTSQPGQQQQNPPARPLAAH